MRRRKSGGFRQAFNRKMDPTSDIIGSVRSVCWMSPRSTLCDVVSLVTTTQPVENGFLVYAKDPSRKPVKLGSNTGGLYAEGVEVMTKAQLQERLLLERRVFMTQLRSKRIEHSRRYTSAAVKIQSFLRMHLVRKHWERLRATCETRKVIRELVRGKHHKSLVASRSRFVFRRRCRENRSAELIQQRFRRYLQTARDMRERQMSGQQLSRLATKLQSLQRGSKARHRAASIVYERYFAHHTRIKDMGPFQLSVIYRTTAHGLNVAAAMIQRMVRRRAKERSEELQRVQTMIYLSRQRNATRIQATYRGYRVRKYFATLDASITKLQCLVRRFLAGRTAARVRVERIEFLRRQRSSAVKIQKIVRWAAIKSISV